MTDFPVCFPAFIIVYKTQCKIKSITPLNRQMPEISFCCLCRFYMKIQDAIVLPTGISAMAYIWLPQVRQGNMPLPQALGRDFLLPDGGNC